MTFERGVSCLQYSVASICGSNLRFVYTTFGRLFRSLHAIDELLDDSVHLQCKSSVCIHLGACVVQAFACRRDAPLNAARLNYPQTLIARLSLAPEAAEAGAVARRE